MSNRNIKRSGRLKKPDDNFIKPAMNAEGRLKMDGKIQVFHPFISLTDIKREVTFHPTKGYRVRRAA